MPNECVQFYEWGNIDRASFDSFSETVAGTWQFSNATPYRSCMCIDPSKRRGSGYRSKRHNPIPAHAEAYLESLREDILRHGTAVLVV